MRLPREMQVPKQALKVADKKSDAVAFVYTNRFGQLCARVFYGKCNKAVIACYFRSAEQREKSIAVAFESRQRFLATKAAIREKRKAVENTYKIGDLFKWVWGYDQTNINYFEVIESKGRYVTVREIKSASFETSGMTGKCSPLPGEFKDGSKPKRCLVQGNYIKVQPWKRGGCAYYLAPKMVGGVPVYGSDGFSTYA